MIASAADGASKFESLLLVMIESDVSELFVCRGSFAGVVIELVSLSTTSNTIISFTLFSSRYTLGWPPFVP